MNQCQDPKIYPLGIQKSQLGEWCAWLERSNLEPMLKVRQMVLDHWDGITRCQESRINNGILEGLNSVIQAAKRKARGYKFKHFKSIVYLMTRAIALKS